MNRSLLLSLLVAPVSPACAQVVVSPVFATRSFPQANIDSTAVWVAPRPADSLLFVTEKEGDRVQVWFAATGAAHPLKPFLGGVVDSSAPGQFNRPNGVWVIYHVPYADGFTDLLLVTEQMNPRVQAFRLPELEYFGEFGKGEIGKGYGLAWYQDGTDFFVFISDNIPPAGFPGKLKKYRLLPGAAGLSAEMVSAFGASGGTPPLPNVESIFADLHHDRLHVCGDEGGDQNYLFRLDGSYLGPYGDPQFEFDQEGINLYDLGGGTGYLIISDQYRTSPNQFEVFDRATLAPLGYFQTPAGTALSTTNTDGAFLEQRPLPGFPNGAFFPVNNDLNVHVYDWTDIAEARGLEIVALDRPFTARGVPGAPAAEAARPVLWFHDGSWWGALPGAAGLSVWRLEDGTFAHQATIDAGEAAAAAAAAGTLAVLTREEAPRLLLFEYQPALRAYRASGPPVPLPMLAGALSDLALEVDGEGNPVRGWVAWVADGEARAAWSAEGISAWSGESVLLGPAALAGPRLVRLGGAVAVLWSEPGAVAFRLHRDEDPPGAWSAREQVSSIAAEALAVAGGPAGTVFAVLAAGGRASLWTRAPAGGWTESPIGGPVFHPALVVDGPRGRLHLFHSSEAAGRRLIHHREAALGSAFPAAGPPGLAWPGVSFEPVLFPAALPAEAPDLVAAALGNDGLGYFFREPLPAGPDLSPPITLQHAPPPGAREVKAGETVSFRIEDRGAGVDRAGVRLLLNGQAAQVRLRGVPRNLLASAVLPPGIASPVRVRIEAADRASPPNTMAPFEYELEPADAEAGFRRGDANGDGGLDLSDALKVLLALFLAGPQPPCPKSADANDDGQLDLADALSILGYLFREDPPLPAPGPTCGADPTPDALECGTSCG